MVRSRPESVLNEKWADFIQGGVAIMVSSRDSRNLPTLARGVGCRVTANRQKVTLLMGAPQAQDLMNAVRLTGVVAAVFSQPSTHISVQLKGNDATLAPGRAADVQIAKRHEDAFVAETNPLGYPEDLIRALLSSDAADLMAITFTPIAAFLQTPGPRAGESLSS